MFSFFLQKTKVTNSKIEMKLHQVNIIGSRENYPISVRHLVSSLKLNCCSINSAAGNPLQSDLEVAQYIC